MNGLAAREHDGLPALELAALPAGRHAERVGDGDVEAAGTLRLGDQVADRLRAVVDRERADLVVAAVEHVAGAELDGLDRVGEAAEDPPKRAEQVAEARRAVERQRHLAAAEGERLQHPGQPEVVVGVEVREEDVLEVDQPDVRAQELPLRPLAAVDQEPVAAAADQRRRRGPLGGGSRARRPEEHDVEVHGASVSPRDASAR